MKLIHDISQQAATGGEHAVSHVSGKFSIRLGKMFGNFI